MVKRPTETGLSHVVSKTTCYFSFAPQTNHDKKHIFVNMGHLPPSKFCWDENGEKTCLKASPRIAPQYLELLC